MTVYAYDTEFIERGATYPLDLLSIGMVSSDGRELYLENVEADWRHILRMGDPWLRENVLPHIKGPFVEGRPWWPSPTGDQDWADAKRMTPWRHRDEIRDEILAFTDPQQHGPIERWVGYYADYDHVLLSQLFGRMVDLPKGYPMWTWDLKQEAARLGINWLGRLVKHDPEVDGPEHSAISDARWVMRAYRFLETYTP